MKIEDFGKLVQRYTENNISSNEPHVGMRCEENNISLDEVKRTLLFEYKKIVRIVEDRPGVYKLYYRLGKKTELKVIIDLFTYSTINIRTVKRLSNRFKLGFVRRL